MSEDRLPERVENVLNALRSSETEWVSRRVLAEKLGRRQLNQLDVAALTLLEAQGQIEVERRPDPRPVAVVYYYRVKAS